MVITLEFISTTLFFAFAFAFEFAYVSSNSDTFRIALFPLSAIYMTLLISSMATPVGLLKTQLLLLLFSLFSGIFDFAVCFARGLFIGRHSMSSFPGDVDPAKSVAVPLIRISVELTMDSLCLSTI